MKMRKILSVMMIGMIAAGFMACDDDEKEQSGSIVISNDQLNQTAWADDQDKTIQFVAAESWYSKVDFSSHSKADSIGDSTPWLTLDPENGGAGNVTVKVNMAKNLTGKDRSATIRILCGSSVSTISVQQKGTTEDGNVPDAETSDSTALMVREIVQYDEGVPYSIVFNYDGQKRVSDYSCYVVTDSSKQLEYKTTLTYSGNQITRTIESFCDGYESGTWIYTIENGRVVSGRDQSENFDGDIWRYDSLGNMSLYVEQFSIAQQEVDSVGNVWEGEETIDSTLTYYFWNDGVIETMLYQAEPMTSADPVTTNFEYYETGELLPPATTIQLPFIIDEISANEMTIYGLTGNGLQKFVKSVTVSGDPTGENNGTTNYRYVTDSKGNVTQIYAGWTSANGSAAEQLLWEIKY